MVSTYTQISNPEMNIYGRKLVWVIYVCPMNSELLTWFLNIVSSTFMFLIWICEYPHVTVVLSKPTYPKLLKVSTVGALTLSQQQISV